jgi:hypothetical protein
MKRSGRYAALVAALMVCLLVPGRSDEQRPLLKLAEAICMQGEWAEDSEIFALFKLRGPFLFMASGADMLAMSGRNCHNLRRSEAGSVLLVLGHRREPGIAMFFLTSLTGDLIESARGLAVRGGEAVFVAVPIDEVRDDFERAKTFWLTNIDLSPVALRNN